MSEGRLHGIAHWYEGVTQIRHEADDKPGDGARNIKHNGRLAENVLVCTGMLGHGVGVILSDEPR